MKSPFPACAFTGDMASTDACEAVASGRADVFLERRTPIAGAAPFSWYRPARGRATFRWQGHRGGLQTGEAQHMSSRKHAPAPAYVRDAWPFRTILVAGDPLSWDLVFGATSIWWDSHGPPRRMTAKTAEILRPQKTEGSCEQAVSFAPSSRAITDTACQVLEATF